MIHEITDEMTHDEAVATHAVECYLLGELAGFERDRFEEHLFECVLCATDLKAGASFVSAALPELEAGRTKVLPFTAPVRRARSVWQMWGLTAALAACLGVVVYQGAVVVPNLHRELAEARTPAVLAPLVLANPGARGEASLPTVVADHGSYLLAVEIPPKANAQAFRCTLVSPAGKPLWQLEVAPEQTRDAVMLKVPAQLTPSGVYEMRVEAVPIAGSGDTLVLLANYRYRLGFATAP